MSGEQVSQSNNPPLLQLKPVGSHEKTWFTEEALHATSLAQEMTYRILIPAREDIEGKFFNSRSASQKVHDYIQHQKSWLRKNVFHRYFTLLWSFLPKPKGLRDVPAFLLKSVAFCALLGAPGVNSVAPILLNLAETSAVTYSFWTALYDRWEGFRAHRLRVSVAESVTLRSLEVMQRTALAELGVRYSFSCKLFKPLRDRAPDNDVTFAHAVRNAQLLNMNVETVVPIVVTAVVTDDAREPAS